MRHSDSAFTLLEVMAAVAVVAIVFTTLARVANQGLQSQGTSRRRFEASLVADRALADVEAGLKVGIIPELGKEESEEGIFGVFVEVIPFDLASVVPEDADAPGDAAAPTPAARAEESAVRAIEITVIWEEGFEEHSVVRTTFGLDHSASLLPSENGGGAAPLPGGERFIR